MKIGITFDAPEKQNGLFSNGLKQNAIFFYMMLESLGYDVYFITQAINQNYIKLIPGKYKSIVFENILKVKFDIIFQFTTQIPLNSLLELKKTGTKLVIYKCGNDYIMDMEEILYSARTERIPQHSALSGHNPTFDEMWIIPQHENTNFYYWKTLYRCDVKIVDPIWSPYFIEKLGKGLEYKNKGESKKLAIFEPNINVVKWFFPALLVCENAYRSIPNKISHAYVTNVVKENKNINVKLLNSVVKSLDLFIDGKISIEDRYNTLNFMSNYSDIAVSHQWENPLNYIYLDLAWMGWPIVHNAHLCKDVGYYYEGFNYEEGGKVLTDVINNHDKESDEYLKRNRESIDRFLPSNKDVRDNYTKLINELIKK